MILYWVVYDVIIRGIPVFYLDVYSRGVLTWWLDSETFWGNYLLSTVKALILSGFLVLYSPNLHPARSADTPARKSLASGLIYWSFGLLSTIFIIMIVFSTYSPGSGARLDLVSILFNGWYQDYFCSRVIELVLFVFNVFFIFPLIIGIKKNYEAERANNAVFMYFSIAWFIGLYLAWKSEWSLWGLVNMNFIFDYIASLLFIFPLVTYFSIRSDAELIPNAENIQRNKVLKLHLIVRLVAMVIIYGVLIYVLYYFDNQMILQIELKIRFETSWFFRNFLSWLYIVFLATLLYIFGKHYREVIK